jgi:hypothetical protein
MLRKSLLRTALVGGALALTLCLDAATVNLRVERLYKNAYPGLPTERSGVYVIRRIAP